MLVATPVESDVTQSNFFFYFLYEYTIIFLDNHIQIDDLLVPHAISNYWFMEFFFDKQQMISLTKQKDLIYLSARHSR